MRADRWDVGAAAVALVVAGADLAIVPGVTPTWAAAVTELPAAAALVLRRARPLVCMSVAAFAAGAELSLGVPANRPFAPVVVIVIAMYSVAAHQPVRRALLALPVLAALVTFGAARAGLETILDTASLAVVVGLAAWAGGAIVRARTVRAVALAREIERREHAHAHAMLQERTRIARELHDIVAHAISVMVVQAGAAESVLDRQPARAREAIAAVQATGRQAVAEMARLIGLLRDDSGELGLGPVPGRSDLGPLVERFRTAGLPVSLTLDGSLVGAGPALELTAYRIVQEALTNALKHGARKQVCVRVATSAEQLALTIDDVGVVRRDAAPREGGHGLAGMHERVTLVGGAIETGPTPDGFRVRARLPLVTGPT